MGLMKCPDCKRKISRHADVCPYCGHPFRSASEIIQERRDKKELKKARKTQKAQKVQGTQSQNLGCLSYVIIIIVVVAMTGRHFGTNNSDSSSKASKNSDVKVTDTPIPEPTSTPVPQAVSIEDSTVLPALKLFDNYEEYNNQYVTISAPISYASEDIVEIDNDAAGKFYVTLLEPRSDLSEGDYMTVTGLVNGISLGEVQLDNSNISATGGEPAQLFEQGKQDYSNESGKIIEGVELSEQDFKSRCKEMWYEDIVFSDSNLEGEYVKVKLYIEDSGVINSKKYYDAQVMELIQKYNLDKTISMVGIYSKDTDSYGSSKDLGILYSLNTGYSGSDFAPGTYITLYGKIINYAVNKWDGHNSAYFMPEYIERN